MLAIRKILPALLGLSFAFQASLAHGLTIRFHRQATVDRPFVYLGDIAEITASDTVDLQAYRSAKLIPAPPKGGQVYLDFDSIRNRLQALGLSFSSIEFSGASRVLVMGATTDSRPTTAQSPKLIEQQMPHDSTPGQANHAKRVIQKVIRSSLTKQDNRLNVDERQIEVHLHEQAITALANSNPAEWQIRSWTPPQAGRSHLVLIPTTQNPERMQQRVECDIRMPPLVLTVQQAVAAGQTLQAADLTWMYAGQASGLIQPQEVIGMETKRNLRPGVAIQEDDLQKKPYVRPRDVVSVYARQGGITVKRTMRALKGGGLGETVPLVSLSGKEKFIARIIGYHKTEVIGSAN